MTEFTQFISSKQNLTDQSKKNYANRYKVLRSNLAQDIGQTSQELLIHTIKEMSKENPNTAMAYLNLPIIIRNYFGLKVDKLEHFREQLKGVREKYTKEQKIETDQMLPSIKVIKDYTSELYNSGNLVKYVVNFLLINYGVRNKDLNVFITTKEFASNPSINYLIVKQNEIEWRINDYKTLQTYGIKKIIIKSKPFILAIKSIPINSFLLNVGGVQISNNSLSKIIQRMTYNDLGEGNYFKIIMKSLNNEKDAINKLQYFANSRGTDFPTLLEYYNTNQYEHII